jgi:assimilatory nitrate reductase catalytic subunit
LIFIGANPAISHPIMWNRVQMNETDRKMITLDPRKTKTAAASDVHLPLYPKSDLTLLYAVINELIRRDWIDKDYVAEHTEGFDELKANVAEFTLERAAEESGISVGELTALVHDIHEREAVSIYWTMGVNQSHQAVRTAQAIINICLLTGNIGRPGTGPNSITGQANAMGSRLYSNTTALYALRNFTDAEDRKTTAEILGIPEEVIPQQNSLPYHRILEKVADDEIKALWVIATNPAHSWINKTDFFAAMKKLDFLVVQDLYATTETAQVADLFLPAAGSGEKDGTFINSERRIGIVQKVQEPPGQAKSDFDIFRMIADRWGCGEMLSEWSSPEAVFRILQRTSRGRPCDITGIQGYQEIIDKGGIQWPYPAGSRPQEQERRLFADGKFFTPSGKAKLLFDPPRPLPEAPDAEYPYLLLTGRGTVVQWHTQTRTGKVAMLNKLSSADCYVEINSADAAKLGVETGEWLKLSSRRGSAEVKVKVDDALQEGQLFVPMHYRQANWLTYPAFDPYSFEPAYKAAAVKAEKVSHA